MAHFASHNLIPSLNRESGIAFFVMVPHFDTNLPQHSSVIYNHGGETHGWGDFQVKDVDTEIWNILIRNKVFETMVSTEYLAMFWDSN